MAEVDRLFGNMSDKEYEMWMAMSKEERQEMARELALGKRKKRDQKKADDMAKAKKFRKDAIKAGAKRANASKQPIFNEEYSLETSPDGLAAKALANEKLKITEREPLQFTDYRGVKGTAENLSKIPLNTGEERLSLHPTARMLQKNALSEQLEEPTTVDPIAVDETFVDEPRVVAPINQLLEARQEYDREKSGNALLEQAEEDRVQTDEFADAQETVFDDEGNPISLSPEDEAFLANQKGVAGNTAAVAEEQAMEQDMASPGHPLNKDSEAQPEEGLGFMDQLKLAGGAYLSKKLDVNPLLKKKTKDKIIDKIIPTLEKEINKEEKTGGLINLEKKKVTTDGTGEKKKKGEGTGDFVDYDKNGYPIYKKGSKWGKSFNDAFGKSLEQEGNKTFSWTGHDGKSRSYTNDRAVKTIKEAPAPIVGGSAKDLDAQESAALQQSDAQAEENQLLYGNAKTEVERDKVVEKVIEAETTPKKKIEAAGTLRENDKRGPDRYFVDPFTGWAMCLTCADRRRDRKDIMELAKTLPVDTRAAYYFSKGLIKRADFNLITKDKNLQRALDTKIKELAIEEGTYKVIAAKAVKERDPKRAEYLKMFLNASTNKNYELLSHLGGLLDLDEGIMKTMKESQLKYEMAKLDSKANKGGLKKAFSGNFGVEYSTVITNKLKWIDKATAIIQTKGKLTEYVGLDGTKMVDRSGRFRTYGLKEQPDMRALTHAQQTKIIERSPYAKLLMGNTAFHNSNGKFDVSLLVKNKDAYEQYLKNDLVYFSMNDAYNGQYEQMMAWVDKNSYNYQKEQAELKKLLTANASLTEKGDKKRSTSELKL